MTTRNQICFGTTLSLFLLAASAQASSSGAVNPLGGGLSYATPSNAVLINPALLTEARGLEVEGGWRFEPSLGYAGATYGAGSLGVGAGDRPVIGRQVYEAGVALRASRLSLGASVYGQDANSLDGDAGFVFDLSKFRLAGVARSLSGTVDRVDVGIGFLMGSVVFAADVKKTYPLTSKLYYFDLSVASLANPLAVALGYDFSYDLAYHEGGIHGGVAYMMGKITLKAEYRPAVQEWSVGKWVASAQYHF